jgi:hypothetical protein
VLEGRLQRAPLLVHGERVVPSFDFKYEPTDSLSGGTLRLAGPHFSQAGGASADRGGYRCTVEYSFVGSTGDALRMLSGSWASNQGLVAWHPDDEERWYLSLDACQAAARSGSPGGFHVDCYDELSE